MNKTLLNKIEHLENLLWEANQVILLSVEDVNTYSGSCNPGVSGYRCTVCKKLDENWKRNSPKCKPDCLRSIWLKKYEQQISYDTKMNGDGI